MEKLISVIVPVYNAEKYLERSLSSIINQTYKSLEIILVNDGSTDDSLKILKQFQEIDGRIKIVNQINSGVGEARNAGLNIAQGEFISFVDADDSLDSNFYTVLMDVQEIINADIVESGAKVILGQDNIIYPYEKENKLSVFNNHDYIKNYLNFSLNVSVWGKIYKKSLIGNTRFLKLNINEDFYFLWEIVKKTTVFCETLQTNYHYYLDKPVSLSTAPFSKDNMTIINHIDQVISDVKQLYPDLFEVALNHHNAFVLHTLILYFNYLNSSNCKNLYLSSRDILIERARKINKISSYLLLHEANYDIPNLVTNVMSISDSKKGKQK